MSFFRPFTFGLIIYVLGLQNLIHAKETLQTYKRLLITKTHPVVTSIKKHVAFQFSNVYQNLQLTVPVSQKIDRLIWAEGNMIAVPHEGNSILYEIGPVYRKQTETVIWGAHHFFGVFNGKDVIFNPGGSVIVPAWKGSMQLNIRYKIISKKDFYSSYPDFQGDLRFHWDYNRYFTLLGGICSVKNTTQSLLSHCIGGVEIHVHPRFSIAFKGTIMPLSRENCVLVFRFQSKQHTFYNQNNYLYQPLDRNFTLPFPKTTVSHRPISQYHVSSPAPNIPDHKITMEDLEMLPPVAMP